MKFMIGLLFLSQAMGAWAMGAAPNSNPNAPPPPAWMQFVPIMVMIAVFYFVLIRPQSKQRKEREMMINAVKKGDQLLTTGGLIVTVVAVNGDVLDVKINDETRAQLKRSGIAEVLSDPKVIEPTVVS